MTEEAILLNVVLVPRPNASRSDVYIYGKEQFLEKYENCRGKECIKGKYSVEYEYTWYFKTEEELTALLQKRGAAEYFGIDCMEDLRHLTYQAVQCLNYCHTGQPVKKFKSKNIYMGANNKTYICVCGGSYFDSKWIEEKELKQYVSVSSLKEIIYDIPKETEKHIMDFWNLETDIITVHQKVVISEFQIKDNLIFF